MGRYLRPRRPTANPNEVPTRGGNVFRFAAMRLPVFEVILLKSNIKSLLLGNTLNLSMTLHRVSKSLLN